VTEPPAAIVTVEGLNERPAIDTDADDDGAVDVELDPPPLDEPPPPDVAPLEPPTTIVPW